MFMATERHSQFCSDSGNNEALMSPLKKKGKLLNKKTIPKGSNQEKELREGESMF